jgi:hypothetical protein
MQIDPDLLRVLVAVLVPIVPAFILYKFLPGEATVQGTYFNGLKLNLAGAFAGYFLVMVSVFWWFDQHPVQTELWTVEGKVKIPPGATKNDVDISIFPQVLDISSQGQFSIRIPVSRLADGSLKFPSLQVAVHGNEEAIDLDQGGRFGSAYKVSHGNAARTIRIEPEVALLPTQ